MASTADRLVYMANQIATEFRNQHPRTAAEATWDHLWHFWDPGMRTRIVAHLEAGGEGLNPVACEAVARLAGPCTPQPQTHATEYASGLERRDGSDAG